MLVDDILVRPHGDGRVTISWHSETADCWSWIFVSGKLLVGPYMAEACDRSITITLENTGTFVIEIHDFQDGETIPESMEQKPLVQPLIAWNAVEAAALYRVYHTIFDSGTIESSIAEIPPLSEMRMEIDCPVKLEGRGGRWHSFRVETVDQFGNESQNEIVPHFAVDLPPSPDLSISRDTQSGLLTFRIL